MPHQADECCHGGDTLLGGEPELPERFPEVWVFDPCYGIFIPRALAHLAPVRSDPGG